MEHGSILALTTYNLSLNPTFKTGSEFIKQNYGVELEIVKRPPCRFWVHKDTPLEKLPWVEAGFKVQPKRWIVERTFACLNRNRRLSKEYDFHTSTSENFIAIAMNRLILKRP